MLILKGYIAENTDILTLEEGLQKLQEIIMIQGKKLYTELLANEIETLCDDIGFNVVPRPNIPVYDAARQALDQKISNATGRGFALPYNFGIQLTIYTHNNAVYVRMNTSNEKLVSMIKKSPTEFKDFSLHDDRHDNAEQKKREAVWNEIMEIYSKERKPIFRNIFACENVKPEWKKIAEKFHPRDERAETRIRHQLVNHMLNMLGMGQQIPPHKLLPYLEESFMYLDNKAIQADARRMMPQALQSVVNITEELVMQDPNAPAPNTL